MSIDDFEHLVLKLANQTPTRYWKHWNHPCRDPWIMAVEFEVNNPGDTNDPADARLTVELRQRGLRLSDIPGPHGWQLFTVERTI